jgi:hypothetical protein
LTSTFGKVNLQMVFHVAVHFVWTATWLVKIEGENWVHSNCRPGASTSLLSDLSHNGIFLLKYYTTPHKTEWKG